MKVFDAASAMVADSVMTLKTLPAGESLAGTLGSDRYARGQTYSWRLPLGAVLPPKVDAKTGEAFPGNYEFNRFTGDRLQVK